MYYEFNSIKKNSFIIIVKNVIILYKVSFDYISSREFKVNVCYVSSAIITLVFIDTRKFKESIYSIFKNIIKNNRGLCEAFPFEMYKKCKYWNIIIFPNI